MIHFNEYDRTQFEEDLSFDLDLLDLIEDEIMAIKGVDFDDKLNNAPEWLRVLYVYHDFVNRVLNGGIGFLFINLSKEDLVLLEKTLEIMEASMTLEVIRKGMKMRSKICQSLGKSEDEGNLAREYRNEHPFTDLLVFDEEYLRLSDEYMVKGFVYLQPLVSDKFKVK